MLPAARSVSGESLPLVEGVPSSRQWLRRLARHTGLGGAIVGVTLAVASLVASTSGFAIAGYQFEGRTITGVDRSGYAWLDGVRPGQEIISLSGGSEALPDGVVLVTRNGDQTITSRSGRYDFSLRLTLPLAALAVLLALLAVPLMLLRRTLGGLSIIASVLLAAEPLSLLHDRSLTVVALSATLLAPTLFLATRSWLLGNIRLVIAVVGLGFTIGWAVTRLFWSPVHEPLDAIRGPVAFYGFAVASGIELVRTLRRPDLPPRQPLQLVDAVSLAVAVAVIAAVGAIHGFDAWTAAAIVAAVLLYPRFRQLALRATDRLFLSDLRERAAIESAEEERARLARDIHDTSLQELAGVIGQLQSRPDTAEESAALRRVADQLRRMSTELRPPMLDDLGLGAALAFVADRTRSPNLAVTMTIDDRGGIEPETRAPASVELAVFRIVEQAVSNIVLHADASAVDIAGVVSAERVRVSVHDNGRGISRADLEEAARRGRLGLASMRRRAELIGATLDVDGGPGRGTTVALSWSR